MDNEEQRNAIVACAYTWIGTPYHHAGRIKGVGVDCGTFLAEAFAAADIIAPVDIAEYSHDWHLHRSEEQYLMYVQSVAKRVKDDVPEIGDIVIWKFGRCFSHGGIYVGDNKIIHALIRVGVTLDELDSNEFAGRERRVYSVFGGVA